MSILINRDMKLSDLSEAPIMSWNVDPDFDQREQEILDRLPRALELKFVHILKESKGKIWVI